MDLISNSMYKESDKEKQIIIKKAKLENNKPFISLNETKSSFEFTINTKNKCINIDYELKDLNKSLMIYIYDGIDEIDEIFSFKVKRIHEKLDIDDIELIEENNKNLIKIIIPKN